MDSGYAAQVVGVSGLAQTAHAGRDDRAPPAGGAIEENTGPASRPWPAISLQPIPARRFQLPKARCPGWLVTDADPATLGGFTYLDRVGSVGATRPGAAAGVLKTSRTGPGPRRGACLLADPAAPDGWPGTPSARPGLPAFGRPLRHSSPAPAPRRHRPARPDSARPHL